MLSLCAPYPIDRRILLRWLCIIALAKIFWLVIFISLRSNAWSDEATVGNIALQPNESFGYYRPLESLITQGHYQGMCHMPGLLPFYLPLRSILSEEQALQTMILLQVAFDILATFCLGILAARIFQSARALHLTYLFACLSTFTAVRNNYLLSDSLCISFTILSTFCFTTYLIESKKKYLWLTALGMCVAIFLRPAMLAILPGLIVLLLIAKGISRQVIIHALLLIVPSTIAIGAWTIRNKITYDRTIVLLAPLGECQPQITPDFAAIRRWILASGGDYQPWAAGGAAHWFFDSPKTLPMPFGEEAFTADYDSTTLLALKKDYHLLHSATLTVADSLALEASIITRGNKIHSSYVSHHPLRFYLFNRLKFAGMILFPKRIDDLPFPSWSDMNTAQKAIKAVSYISIPVLSMASILAIFIWIVRRNLRYLLWMCLPMGLVVMHSAIGFVEQRYLAASYPFFLMLVAGLIAQLFTHSGNKIRKPSEQPA
jgi:hypothetical protein